MKASKVLILSGVAICSLLACFDSYAVEVPDFVPDSSSSDSVYDLSTIDGYSRKVSSRASSSLLFSCKHQRIGEITTFPLEDSVEYPDIDPAVDPSPCGYYVDTRNVGNPYLAGPLPASGGRIGAIIDNYLNNHHYTLGTLYSNISNSLSPNVDFNSSYIAGDYVSAFRNFIPNINLNDPMNNNWLRFDVPSASGDGYAFYVFTIQNITPDYMNTSLFAPFLNDSAEITINSGSITADEIRSTINNSSIMGWVYDDNGTKKNTFKDCYAATQNNNCSTILPSDELFTPLENYLDVLPVGTYFAVYTFPVSNTYSYTIQNFSFETPDDLTAYGYRFNAIENPEQYWGMPMLWSPSYHKTTNSDDVLRYSGYATNLTYMWIFPTNDFALTNSRYIAGLFNQSNYNQISHQNNLSQIDPNPGTGFWGNIFNLGNIVFPFHSFLTGFTNQQCVSIPILGSWLHLGNDVQYCSWWSSNIRDVLTPIFAVSSMMLLFGFIVHWLRKSDSDKLSYKET